MLEALEQDDDDDDAYRGLVSSLVLSLCQQIRNHFKRYTKHIYLYPGKPLILENLRFNNMPTYFNKVFCRDNLRTSLALPVRIFL